MDEISKNNTLEFFTPPPPKQTNGGQGAIIMLSNNVRPDGTADAFDIRQVKVALNRLGYYVPDKKEGMSAEWDEGLTAALKNFQKAKMILPDGTVEPNDGTHRALNEALENQEEHSEFFARFYIWKTVGDGKVRGEHAARNGKQFAWDDPPGGEHPGEDYNCRCWAEPLIPSAPPQFRAKGLKAGLNNLKDVKTAVELDATNPTLSPLDLLGGGAVVKGGAKIATSTLARLRDTKWVSNMIRSQAQKKFDAHAKIFDIKGNRNNKTLSEFKRAIERHVKSPDTKVIKGTLHKKPVTHYYNPKTKINVIRDSKGDFSSVWKLTDKQEFHILRNGKLGGSKK